MHLWKTHAHRRHHSPLHPVAINKLSTYGNKPKAVDIYNPSHSVFTALVWMSVNTVARQWLEPTCFSGWAYKVKLACHKVCFHVHLYEFLCCWAATITCLSNIYTHDAMHNKKLQIYIQLHIKMYVQYIQIDSRQTEICLMCIHVGQCRASNNSIMRLC